MINIMNTKKILCFTFGIIFTNIISLAQFEPRHGFFLDGGYNLPGFNKAFPIGASAGYRFERPIDKKYDLRIEGKIRYTGSKLGIRDHAECTNCYDPDYKEYDFLFLQAPIGIKQEMEKKEDYIIYISGAIIPTIIIKDKLRYLHPQPEENEIYHLEPNQSEFTKHYIGSTYSLQWLHLNFSGGIEMELEDDWILQAELQCYYSSMNLLSFKDDMLTFGIGVAFMKQTE